MNYNIKYSKIKQAGGTDELTIDQMIALGLFDDTGLTNKQICDKVKQKMNDSDDALKFSGS